MARQHDAAYATLVMTDSYLPGAMVLGHSLKDRGAKARLVALVLIEKLSVDTINELQKVYDDIVPVQQVVNMRPANLYLMNRPDLISTFTKIELWKQTQYKRLVYLDADIVMLRAPNELLTMDTTFAAVPDVGWPDCFNSGMMVLNPNMGDYYALQALANRGISFDGADQGLLNMHFTEWERLSFVYNCTPNANYQYVPAYKHFQASIVAIHFIGAEKPWRQGRDYRTNSGVYGELLARWWAVYDRHYRKPEPVQHNQIAQPQKKVSDYVRGEETRYEPSYQQQPQNQSAPQPSGQRERRRSNSGYQITQPIPQPVPGLQRGSISENPGSMERPFGDQPSIDERIEQHEYTPTSTHEQRRWSAPHAEWEPARQPPPTNSKPEAANFPTQQYEMSQSTQFFEAPVKYPEPPKDMWYEVPAEKPAPAAPPRHIFPWEERAPKATRVFPKSREPTPPLPEESEQSTSGESTTSAPESGTQRSQEHQGQQEQTASISELSRAVNEAFEDVHRPPRPRSPPRHVFPWESRAPKATRVFPPEPVLSPPMQTRAPAIGEEAADQDSAQSTATRPPDNPWNSFAQQTNTWDEDPDIARFMESFNKPRRAPVQVVHDSRSSGDNQLPITERRRSLKLTDFPTEVERPSLPVTPAPIRRPSFWGSDEPDDANKSVLPVASGVPRQDEWVRHFTSQYLPRVPDPVLRDIGVILQLTYQHCASQNPTVKLEELQRMQSLLLEAEQGLIDKSRTPPRREMPESQSAEDARDAAMRSITAAQEKPRLPAKPILREPHFEVTEVADDELGNESIVATAHMTATGSKSPTRFSPYVMEGIAASERNSFSNEEVLREDLRTSSTAIHHSGSVVPFYETVTSDVPSTSSTGFDYSTNSLSPTQSRANLQAAAKGNVIDEEVISPSTVA